MSKSPLELSRRALFAASVAGLASACDTVSPKRGFLGKMERFNEGIERALFRSHSGTPVFTAADETPRGRFPVYFVSARLPRNKSGWTLRIGGMVSRPCVLTLDDLRRMTRRDIRVEHHCVEGWSAIASWHGVPLRDIAERAGADPRAGFVEFRSFDNGYYSSWDRESAMHPQTLVAYGMHGEPLTAQYGAPARIYSPIKLGYKNVKYLTEINFMPVASGGYWENLGYEWYGGA